MVCNTRDVPRGEEELADSLRELPPAPEAWVAAAKELPRARRALADIEERVLRGSEERARVTADLEAALAAAGYEPTPELLLALRRELARGTEVPPDT